MKKKVLAIALLTALSSVVMTGCSSKKAMSGSDTTKVDSGKMNTPPPPAPTDTSKKDTMKKDTVHH